MQSTYFKKMINLLAAPKSGRSPPGRDSRQAHHVKNKKPAEFNPSRAGQASAHACWSGEMRCPTSAPQAAAASARSCRSEVERCADDAELLPPSLPRRVYSSQPPRNLKRLKRLSLNIWGDDRNMSGSAPSRSHSTHVGNHRPPPGTPKTHGHLREEGDGITQEGL